MSQTTLPPVPAGFSVVDTPSSDLPPMPEGFTPVPPPPEERGLVGETVAGFKRGGLQLADMAGNIARAVDPAGGVDIVRNAGFGLSKFAKERAAQPDVAESAYIENNPILGNVPKAAEMVLPSVAVPLAIGAGAGVAGATRNVAAGAGIVGAGLAFGVSQFQDTKERGIEKGLSEQDATTAGIKTGLSEGGLEAVSNIIPATKLFKLGKPVAGQVVKSLFKAPTTTAAVKSLANDALQIMTGEVSTEMAQAYTQGLTEKNAGIRPDADPWREAKDVIGPTIALSLMLGGAVGGVNKLSKVATQRALQNEGVGEDVRTQAAANVYAGILQAEQDGSAPAGAADNFRLHAQDAIKGKKPLVLTDELLAPPQPKVEVTQEEAAANIVANLADGLSPSEAIEAHNNDVAAVKNDLDAVRAAQEAITASTTQTPAVSDDQLSQALNLEAPAIDPNMVQPLPEEQPPTLMQRHFPEAFVDPETGEVLDTLADTDPLAIYKGFKTEKDALKRMAKNKQTATHEVVLRGSDGMHVIVPKEKPPTETITPESDTVIGRNAAGEVIYQRTDVSVYRMRQDRKDRPNGYPDFGGDLSVADQEATNATDAQTQSQEDSQGMGRKADPDAILQGRMKKGEYIYIYDGNGSYRVEGVDGKEVARADVADDGNKDYLSNIRVNKEVQRKGIATELYKYIEKISGKPLRPSPTYQTPDSKAFWAKRGKKKAPKKLSKMKSAVTDDELTAFQAGLKPEYRDAKGKAQLLTEIDTEIRRVESDVDFEGLDTEEGQRLAAQLPDLQKTKSMLEQLLEKAGDTKKLKGGPDETAWLKRPNAGAIQTLKDELERVYGKPFETWTTRQRLGFIADNFGTGDLKESANSALRSKLSKIAGVFGHDVTLLDNSGGKMPDGFVNPIDAKNIYISDKTQNPHLAVLGHEVAHKMAESEPRLFTEMTRKFLALANDEGMSTYLDNFKEGDPRALEEWVGDIFGQSMSTQGFWTEFEKASPSLAGRVATFVSDIIAEVKDKLFSGRVASAAQTIKDFKAVDKIAADVAKRYAERTGGVEYSISRLQTITDTKAARPHLLVVARSIGAKTYKAFVDGMKSKLGALWENFKADSVWLWGQVKDEVSDLKQDAKDLISGKDIEYSLPAGFASGVKASQIQKALKLSNVPIDVFQSAEDTPAHIKADFSKRGLNPEAYYDHTTGRIGVIADNVASVSRVQELMRHEWFHAGVADTELTAIYKYAEKNQAAELQRLSEERGFDLTTPEGQRQAAGEYAAQLAETDPKNSLLQKLVVKIREWLRSLGLRVDFKQGEVVDIIQKAIGRTQLPTSEAPSYSAQLQERLKPFYSQLEKALVKMGGRMPVDQLRNMLKSNQVTNDEIENLIGGLSGVVTKQQVLDEIKANSVELQDVVLGGSQTFDINNLPKNTRVEQLPNGRILVKAPGGTQSSFDTVENANMFIDEIAHYGGDTETTHFSQYTEPGAVEGSYREMFVTAPVLPRKVATAEKDYQAAYHAYGQGKITKEELQAKYDAVRWGEAGFSWTDGHSQYSDIQNPIVRIRFNEREADGKKTLFVEEMQGPSDANQQKMPEYLRKRIYDIGVKRVLSYAKENGFDGVAWTTGEMQAKRYDLSKEIKEIAYTLNDDGTYWVEAYNHSNLNTPVWDSESINEQGIAETLGKEIASKITASATSENQTLSGLDLKVGSEGLKSLYDKTLPALFKKYGKERTEKVEFLGEKVYTSAPQDQELYDYAREEYGVDYQNLTDAQQQEVYSELEAKKDAENKERSAGMQAPYIPITQNTPASFPQYSIAKAFDDFKPENITSLYNGAFANAKFVGTKLFRFIFPEDRIIKNALGAFKFKPIHKQLRDLAEYKNLQTGAATDILSDVHTNSEAFRKVFNDDKLAAKAAEFAFKESLYQLDTDMPLAGQLVDDNGNDTFRPPNTKGYAELQTKAEAFAELRALRSTFTPEQLKILRGMQAHIREADRMRLEALKEQNNFLFGEGSAEAERENAKIDEVKRLAGNYMPLTRFGDYMVRVSDGPDAKRWRTQSFENRNAAADYVKEMRAAGHHTELEVKQQSNYQGATIPATLLDKVKAAAERNGLEGRNLDDFVTEYTRMWAASLPDSSLRVNEVHRSAVAGFDTDLLRVYEAHMQKFANALPRIEYGAKIEQTFRDMRNAIKSEASNPESDPRTLQEMGELYNTLYARSKMGQTEKIHNVVKVINKGVFLNYLASPSTYIVQWSQPFMITLPQLMSRHGLKAIQAFSRGAQETIAGKYSDEAIQAFDIEQKRIGKRVLDLMAKMKLEPNAEAAKTIQDQINEIYNELKTDEQRDLLAQKLMILRGGNDMAFSHDVADDIAGADKFDRGLNKAVEYGGYFMRKSEAGSRRASNIAAFRLEYARTGDVVAASDYAMKVIDDTLYNFGAENRAGWMQGNAGRLLGMFQYFRLHTVAKEFQLLKDSIARDYDKAMAAAETDDERTAITEKRDEARKELAYQMGVSFLLAGAAGTPLAMLLSNAGTDLMWAALQAAFGDDDDPWDFKRAAQEAAQDMLGDDLANLGGKGVFSLVGIDVSKRIGMGGMAQLIQGDPPPGITGTRRAEWYAGRLLGPAWGLVSDQIRAIDAYSKDDMGKALQYSSPKILKDMLKAFELSEKGVEAGGKTILKPEDVTMYDLALKFIGINPMDVSLAQEESRYLKNLSTELSQRRSLLIKKLAEATVEGDVDARQDAIEKLNSWSTKHPKLKVTPQEILTATKRIRDGKAGTLTPKEQLIKDNY